MLQLYCVALCVSAAIWATNGIQCKVDEFSCADGSECLTEYGFCDGFHDCRDGSDEPPLRNLSINYDAKETFCRGKRSGHICVLTADLAPSLKRYCKVTGDGPFCESDEFSCEDGSECLPQYVFCNGHFDCRDKSDETWRNISVEYNANETFCRPYSNICVVRTDIAPILEKYCEKGHECSSEEFACADGSQCTRRFGNAFCDGYPDCRDKSDEPSLRNISIKYEANETFCRGQYGRICVLPADSVLPSNADCKAASGYQCESNEFSCEDGSQCISGDGFCDGFFRNCRDGSDEPPLRYNSIKYDANETFCRANSGRICVLRADVSPPSSEVCKPGPQCESDEFPCLDGSRCLPPIRFCNGYRNCRDGSDEILWNNSMIYGVNETFCRGGGGHICVVQADYAKSILKYCNEGKKCRSDQFPCADGSRCIRPFNFCDGYAQCRDKSDEPLRNSSVKYVANETFCRRRRNICVVPADLAPLLKESCEGHQCGSDEFPCADGSQCISGDRFCDGYPNCRDESDERYRSVDVKYDANETFCRVGNGNICVLRADMVHLSTKFCEPGYECRSDEFLCADWSRCIPGKHFCDGNYHCRDYSDEKTAYGNNFQYSGRGSFCHSIYTGGTCQVPTGVDPKNLEFCKMREFLGQNRFGCLSNPDISIVKDSLCNGVFNCPDLSDECLCSNNRQERCQRTPQGDITPIDIQYYRCPRLNKVATKCDGIPECHIFWGEECNCTDTPEFCTRVEPSSGRYRARCDKKDSYFPNYGYKSMLLGGENLCDGKHDCVDANDERGCEGSRFYCGDDPLPNIAFDQICDGEEDCPNGADELSNGPYFCCSDGGSLNYISQPLVCDGIQDCKMGSDECQNCIVSAFSDDSSLIIHKALLAFVWIISTVALLGCLVIVIITARDFIGPNWLSGGEKPTGHTKIIKLLILSLSISDILVAVYALIICIKAVQLNANYCLVDRSWRSSSTCSALGAILMIGSEQSVFTMVLIASQRLYAVLRPFSRSSTLYVAVAVTLSWLISIILGVVPLIPRLEDYFVSSTMFSENEIFRMMYHNDTGYMIDWLSLMHENSTIGDQFGLTDWSKIRNLTAEINPNISVKYEFGYYSSHTVCLPTFFPDPVKDKAWAYTLFVLLINFFAFIFMAVCYIILYCFASKNKSDDQSRQKGDQQNAKLQRKLTRIVVTDFLCWMPICIMGFLQISGVDIPKDAYLPTGLIIAPINSALNPFLYSDLPEIIMKKLRLTKQERGRRAENPTEVIEMM